MSSKRNAADSWTGAGSIKKPKLSASSSGGRWSNTTHRNACIKPHPNDVLCGRGGHAIRHPGNIRFRMVVDHNKALYQTCGKDRKGFVAQSVVEAIYRQEPPGRFLEHNKKTGYWTVIEKKRAIHKTSQALRENAKELRKKLSEVSNKHSSHDSDSDGAKSDGGESDSNIESILTNQYPNVTQEIQQAPTNKYANNAKHLPEATSSTDWVPESFTSWDDTEASVVSVESILTDEVLSSPTFMQAPERATSLDIYLASPAFLQPPTRATSLDKYDMVPFEEAGYLDALFDADCVVAA